MLFRSALANRLLNAVAKPFEVRGQQIPIGLSVGGTIYPQDATDINALIANADAALFRAKTDGGTWCGSSSPRWTGA